MAFGLDDAIAAGLSIVNKLIPDPEKKAAAALEAVRMRQAGEFKYIDANLQAAQMQADINKIEAGSSSLFVAGWRPGAGWVCVLALAYQFLLRPLSIGFGFAAMPTLDTGDLLTVLLGMLGLGGLRTAEKFNNVAR